jgi:hypothetical protein
MIELLEKYELEDWWVFEFLSLFFCCVIKKIDVFKKDWLTKLKRRLKISLKWD